MKNRKKEIEWNEDTKKRKRRDQVVISRIRTGYTMATHGYIINKQDNNECPSCNVRLTVDNIVWDCKEKEAERQRAKRRNEIKGLLIRAYKSLSIYLSMYLSIKSYKCIYLSIKC
jgi:hypothetical protein